MYSQTGHAVVLCELSCYKSHGPCLSVLWNPSRAPYPSPLAPHPQSGDCRYRKPRHQSRGPATALSVTQHMQNGALIDFRVLVRGKRGGGGQGARSPKSDLKTSGQECVIGLDGWLKCHWLQGVWYKN